MSWRPLLAALVLFCLSSSVGAAAPPTTWVQATTDTQLWSGPDAAAVAFGPVAQWDYFRVERWVGARLYVWDPRSSNYGYLDADKVGPSGPPPSSPPSRAWKPGSGGPGATANLQPWWVQAFQAAPLWNGPDPDAATEGAAGRWSFFQVLEPQRGARLHVRDPLTGSETYVDADAVGPAGPPDDADLVPRVWRGLVGSDQANVRSAPNSSATLLGTLPHAAPVAVQAWVAGEQVFPDQPGWAQLGDGAFVYGPLLRRVALKVPPPLPQGGAPRDGHWIDVNLTLQEVTAYEGDQAVYGAATSSGRPGWGTPVGVFAIQRRVASETMDSSTLLGMDAARASYHVEHVRWTQYFTRGGAALHENYWRDPALFGIPSSHGCLGLQAADAEWFWNWAAVGTPVVVHS